MDELRGGGFAAAGGVAQLLALFLSEGDSISICHVHFAREKQAKAIRTLKCYMISGGVSGRAAQIPSGERLRHYFRELADETPIDIILYNIPQFSNEISLDVVKRLAADCFVAVNFPEGFREGVNLREFHTGRRPQPMSPHEMGHFNAIREKLECLLSECGFDGPIFRKPDAGAQGDC